MDLPVFGFVTSFDRNELFDKSLNPILAIVSKIRRGTPPLGDSEIQLFRVTFHLSLTAKFRRKGIGLDIESTSVRNFWVINCFGVIWILV